MAFVLSDNLVDRLVNYLGTQPYAEVAQLIQEVATAERQGEQNGQAEKPKAPAKAG